MPDSLPEVENWMKWAAQSAVETQQVFDNTYTEKDMMLGTPRMRISRFEVVTEFEAAMEKSTAYEVKLQALNLGYRISRNRRDESDVRFTLTVHQIPVPVHGS